MRKLRRAFWVVTNRLLAILSPSPLLFGQYESLLVKQLFVIFFTTTTTMYLEEPDQVNSDEL